MSTALSPVSPDIFKTILEEYGYRLGHETDSNWTLYKEDSLRPIITLPKKGKLVSVTIMMGLLDQLKINDATYFKLLKQAQK